VLFERAVLREMDRVQAGEDPYGVVQDPNQVIDTNFEFFRQTGGTATSQYSYEGLQVHKRNGSNGHNGSTNGAGTTPRPTGARA
jgi:hypothetical protein